MKRVDAEPQTERVSAQITDETVFHARDQNKRNRRDAVSEAELAADRSRML
ncbi:hypothetical protein JOB18_022451 [Solea senegalensis]|uniref:Uncharacterized protein n=1 Tax=Solea senegalensis TaxID=28829 RepID=A0AAV6PXD6_SOLSE|nr:hypothetical protein JOB18_022451 [Solea senegalensis]